MGVFVDLHNSEVSGGDADGDIIRNFEAIIGSRFNDELTGDDSRHIPEAGNGHDTLIGNGGDDTLYGENGNDTIRGGRGSDGMAGGDGADSFMTYANDIFPFETDHILDYDPDDTYYFENSLEWLIDIQETDFGAAYQILGWQMVVMGSTVENLEDQMQFFG